MYRANQRHLQPFLISNITDLPATKRKRLEQSWAHTFYREFFCRINEDAFAVLYVDYPSRPNVPINWTVFPVLFGQKTIDPCDMLPTVNNNY